MRQPPTYTSWKITAQSPDDARKLQQWLTGRIDLDRVWTDTVRTSPNGVDQVREVPHRLGDFFAEIRTQPADQDTSQSFQLVFRRRQDAGRFWKDLMVNILEVIGMAPQKATVELESKADVDPTT